MPMGNYAQTRRELARFGMRFKLVSMGSFRMGSDISEGYPEERPAHSVRIHQPFFVGVHPVTVRAWNTIMHSDCPNHLHIDAPKVNVSTREDVFDHWNRALNPTFR